MQRNINFLCLLLAACCTMFACNKNDADRPEIPHDPAPSPSPTNPPDPGPVKTVCIPLGALNIQQWGSNGFWLDDVLQFEPAITAMKDTAGYWLLKAEAKNNERIYLCFRRRPEKSWMYYLYTSGFPLGNALGDTCEVAVAYSNGDSKLIPHVNLTPGDLDWDKVPVYVTEDSIYVNFEYSAGASTGGPPYKIAGRVKGKKNY